MDSSTAFPVSQRVPVALQKVFVLSQRGKEVKEPPPNGVAFKSFRWFPRRGSSSSLDVVESEATDCKGPMEYPKSPSPTCKRSSVGSGTPPSPTRHHISPQAYLTATLKSRGYATTFYDGLATGYARRPTPFQLASYGSYSEQVIQENDATGLRKVLEAGLSPDACEPDGRTLVHMACHYGHKECLSVLLEFGGSVEIVDQSGRTPLHLACMASEHCFEIIDMILNQNRRLFFIQDCKGKPPLAYLPEYHWTRWTRYLMASKEKFWPDRCLKKEGLEEEDRLALQRPDLRSMSDSAVEISLHMAVQLAEGQISPFQALLKRVDENLGCNIVSDDDDNFGDDDDDDEDDLLAELDDSGFDDDDDEDCTEATFDEKEMQEILGCIGRSRPVAWISRNESSRG